MTHKNALKIFDEKKVRTIWDDEQEKWYFSIIDVIEILTESPRPRKYWNALKTKLQNARLELEEKTGKAVVSPINSKKQGLLKNRNDD